MKTSLKFIVVLCLVALAAACATLCAAETKAEPEISVTVEGSAVVVNGDIAKAEDEALGDAKRNAVEKALGVLVKADTVGSDFQIVADTILTRSEGYISEWNKIPNSRTIAKVHGSDILTLKIEAKVRLVNLIDDATDIGPIYSAVDRPRVMVLIYDEVGGKKTGGVSTSGTAIMRALQDRGFEVVDADVIARNLKNPDKSLDSGNLKDTSEIAVKEGAEVLILGSAKAVDGPTDDSGAIKTASAILDARVVYADTAQVLYTAKQVQGRGASFGDADDAGLKALRDAGDRLVHGESHKLITQILAGWVLELQSGRVYRVVAEGVSFGDVDALKRALRDLRGHVEFVGQASFSDKSAVINVRSKLSPEQFRAKLAAIKLGKKSFEIRESSGLMTCIKAKQ